MILALNLTFFKFAFFLLLWTKNGNYLAPFLLLRPSLKTISENTVTKITQNHKKSKHKLKMYLKMKKVQKTLVKYFDETTAVHF